MRTAWLDVAPDKFKELARQQVRRTGSPKKGGVHDDEVELCFRIPKQPAVTVVNEDADLPVSQKAGNFCMFRDELQVARVDFDNGKAFHFGIVGHDLRPGATGEPN